MSVTLVEITHPSSDKSPCRLFLETCFWIVRVWTIWWAKEWVWSVSCWLDPCLVWCVGEGAWVEPPGSGAVAGALAACCLCLLGSLKFYAFKWMIFVSNWSRDLEERCAAPCSAVELLVGEQGAMLLVFWEKSLSPSFLTTLWLALIEG